MKRPSHGEQSFPKQSGFTLIEFIVAITVLAILSSVALPSFRNLLLNSSRTTTVNEFLAAIASARSRAMREAREVVVCSSSGIADGCSGNGDNAWSDGILVFEDQDGDQVLDNNETVVLFSNGVSERSTIVTSADAFIFRPYNLRSTNDRILICDQRGVEHAKEIVINVSGRPHVSSYGEDSGNWSCP